MSSDSKDFLVHSASKDRLPSFSPISTSKAEVKNLLDFWFGPWSSPSYDPKTHEDQWRDHLWWNGSFPEMGLRTRVEMDDYLRKRWGHLLEPYGWSTHSLLSGDHPLRHWLDEGVDGTMALLILFSQVSRHVYRYNLRAYGFDHHSLELANELDEESLYKDLPLAYKMFVNVALMQMEIPFYTAQASFNLLRLVENFDERGPIEKSLRRLIKISEEHHRLLKRFKRYPHRNHALCRPSTEEELVYLSSKHLPSWVRAATDPSTLPQRPPVKTPLGPKLKILVLHGQYQNAEGFLRKTRNSLERRLAHRAELFYFDAPNPCSVADLYCWWNTEEGDSKSGDLIYNGLERSVAFVNGLFRIHDFDGIVGFSQGATLAAFLALLTSRKDRDHLLEVDHIRPKLKFVACISGFPLRDVRLKDLYSGLTDGSINLPSFHSWGLTDPHVEPERSAALARLFVDPTVQTHPSAHYRRAIKYWPIDKLAGWLEGFMDHCSPSPFPEDLGSAARDLMMKGDPSSLTDSLLRYLITSQEFSADSIWTLLKGVTSSGATSDDDDDDETKDGDDGATNNEAFSRLDPLLAADAQFWPSLLELNKVKPRDLYQAALGDHLVTILVGEYKRFVLAKEDGLPSTLARYVPRYRKSRSHPQRDLANLVAFGIAKHLNIFNPEKESLERETFESDLTFKQAVLTQYSRLLSSLNRLHPPSMPSVSRRVIPKEPLETLLAAPLSDYILHPSAEPIDGAPREAFGPLYTYLTSHEAETPAINLVFPQGTVCSDGRLDLCKHPMASERKEGEPHGVSDLIKALASDSADPKPKVTHLLLGNNCYGNSLGKAVASFIASGRSALTSWYLAGNDMTSEGMEPLCDALAHDVQVQQLWLKRNPLHKEGVIPIAKMFQTNSYLETLDLANTGLMDDGASALFEGLRHNSTLKHLYLGANGLTAASCKVFASLGPISLRVLSLGANRLGDEGAAVLAEAMVKRSIFLETLDLSSCGIGPTGAKALGKAIQADCLAKLNLGFLKSTGDLGEVPNRISDEGAEALAQALCLSTSLRSLDLTFNDIGLRGVNALAGAIQDNSRLCHCNLEQSGGGGHSSRNRLSRELVRKVAQRNYDALEGDARVEVDRLLSPPHLAEILSVYRIA